MNPLDDHKLNWELPSDMESNHEVDPRSVGSPEHVTSMLVAVSYVGSSQGPRFVAFFACMYYGMLRPEEVIGLRVQDCHLPEDGWGRLVLGTTRPAAGRAWTDSGDVHDQRGLKHRPKKAVRTVPIPSELVYLLRSHLRQFGAATDGRLFRSVNHAPVNPSTYIRVWKRAREYGISADARPTPLLATPYDLRHAGVSMRLYAGVPAKQVAEWAGHSVDMLLRVYAKVLDGFDDTWFQRMDQVLGA